MARRAYWKSVRRPGIGQQFSTRLSPTTRLSWRHVNNKRSAYIETRGFPGEFATLFTGAGVFRAPANDPVNQGTVAGSALTQAANKEAKKTK